MNPSDAYEARRERLELERSAAEATAKTRTVARLLWEHQCRGDLLSLRVGCTAVTEGVVVGVGEPRFRATPSTNVPLDGVPLGGVFPAARIQTDDGFVDVNLGLPFEIAVVADRVCGGSSEPIHRMSWRSLLEGHEDYATPLRIRCRHDDYSGTITAVAADHVLFRTERDRLACLSLDAIALLVIPKDAPAFAGC